MKKRHNRRSTTALVCLALSSGCSKAPAARANVGLKTPLVRTSVVALTPKATLRVTGRLWAASRRQLGFSAPGVVTRMLVEAGDKVRAGQLLAVLDNAEASARLGAAAATARGVSREWQDLGDAQAAGVFPEHERLRAETSLRIAEAEVADARAVLGRRVLQAPVDGTVFKRLVTVGEAVAPGRPVLVLDETSLLVVDCGLVASEISRVKKGDPARLTAHDQSLDAQVFSVSSAPEDDGALYTVRIRLGPDKTQWPLGLLVSVEFPDSARGSVIQVGLPAVMNRQDRDHVFVVADKAGQTVAWLRPVVLGHAFSQTTEVLAGLTPGERIVTEGGYFLRDGQDVSVAHELSDGAN